MQITFYNCSCENNRVDKTDYLTNSKTYTGTLKDGFSVLGGAITIDLPNDNPIFTYNYCYILEFNRYYFITNIGYGVTGLVSINLTLDPLMTYKELIYNTECLIDRNEFEYNDYLIDANRIYEADTVMDVYTVTNKLLDTDPCYILSGYTLRIVPEAEIGG